MSRPTHLALAAGLLAACAANDPGPASVRDQLAAGRSLRLDPVASTATLHADIYRGVTPYGSVSVDLPMIGGALGAGLDEHDDLVLEDVAISLGTASMGMAGDAVVPGVVIGDFTFRSDEPLAFPETVWGDDDDLAMAIGARATFAAAWTISALGVEDDGRIEVHREVGVEVDVMVLPDEEDVELLGFARSTPLVWSWGPFVISSELELTIDGSGP